MHWTDHKTIGLQYAVTALGFLLVGFLLMLLMRWQLAWPTAPMPAAIAGLLGEANAPGGYMLPEFYNQLVAMHGTVMIFLAVVPLLAGAFANFGIHEHIAIQAIAWGVFFVFVLIRFRQRAPFDAAQGSPERSRGAQPQPRQEGLRPLVPVLAIGDVVAGDAFLLATSALPAWLARSIPPSHDARPLDVRVIAEQFVWNIHYPGPDGTFGQTSQALIGAANPVGIDRGDPAGRDDIGLLNVLTLPLGRPVIVHLSSRDVIHSFTLNEMRVRQDVTPGIPTRTWFTPIVAGTWDIACSQLCGLGHYRMRGEYTVLAADQWDRWLASEVALLQR